MFGGILRGRRGVSELVASLTMLLIVSIAGTLLYSYSVNALSSSWSSFSLLTHHRIERAQERFSIIAIWWSTSDQLNLTILNYGKIEIAIDAVYMNGKAVTSFISGKGTMATSGNITFVRFASPIAITEGQIYEIAAVTERGSRDVVYWKA